MRLRPEITNTDLIEASDHLFYEIWMLYQSAAHIVKDHSQLMGTPTGNALIESFVIHARNLLSVFYENPQKPDDVVAGDFFDDPRIWRKVCPKKTELLEGVSKRAGKEMAHLTYARLSVMPETKPWRFLEICKDVGKIVEIFQVNVPRDRVIDNLLTLNFKHEFKITTLMDLP